MSTLANIDSVAGRPTLRQHWTTVAGEEVRLSCLSSFLEDIWKCELICHGDEVASARRKYKDLIGPTLLRKTQQWLREGGYGWCLSCFHLTIEVQDQDSE